MSEAVLRLPRVRARRRRRRWRPPTEVEWMALVLCAGGVMSVVLWVYLAVVWWPARIFAPAVGAFDGLVFADFGPIAVRYLRDPWRDD